MTDLYQIFRQLQWLGGPSAGKVSQELLVSTPSCLLYHLKSQI